MKIFNNLITSNIYISLCASSLYVYYALVLERNFFASTVLSIFAGTNIAYFFVRWVSQQKRSQKFSLPKISSFILLGFLGIISIYGIKDFNLIQLLLSLLSLILVITYERFFFSKKSLRTLPYIKPFVISLAWTNTCVLLHFEKLTLFFIINFIECFLLIFSLCLAFDLKDMKEDKRYGLKSLTHLLTPKKMQGIIYSLLLLSFFVSLPVTNWTLLLSSLIAISFFYITAIKYKEKNTLFAFLIDGIILIKCFLYFYFL